MLLLSAYDAGSHARWRNVLTAGLPEYEWHILTLPPRHFRWRIRGNPLSWLNEPLLQQSWDGLVVTTMVDLATLRGLIPALAMVPALAYCHENQFVYPQQAEARADIAPQMVNLYTLLSAERVVFNSDWNRRSFLSGMESLLECLPDRKPSNLRDLISIKSCVIPVPLQDDLFQSPTQRTTRVAAAPHLIWNHRWEHDKAPDRLLLLLRALRRAGFSFRLSVVGEQFRHQPDAFARIAVEFADHLVQWGYVATESAYRLLLSDADVVLSTALHDFQGLAILEAMAAGAHPWVPDRLAYPEYVPENFRYASDEGNALAEAEAAALGLQSMWRKVAGEGSGPAYPDAFRSSRLIPLYRRELEHLFEARGRKG